MKPTSWLPGVVCPLSDTTKPWDGAGTCRTEEMLPVHELTALLTELCMHWPESLVHES